MPVITRNVGQVRIGPGQRELVIFRGAKLIVTGMLCSATVNDAIFLLDADTRAVLTTIRVLANTSFEIRTIFSTNKGLAITTGPNSECTIFYTIFQEIG